MKKHSLLLLPLVTLLISSCTPSPSKTSEYDDVETGELLEESMEGVNVNVVRDDDVKPLEIPDEDVFDESTRALYEFEEKDPDKQFTVIDSREIGRSSPYVSESDIYPSASDIVLSDNHGQQYDLKNLYSTQGQGRFYVPVSSFDDDKVYNVELKNDDLSFFGKDPSIRKLTFYPKVNREASLHEVEQKEGIVSIDSTKVLYYDEDGYSPFFVYGENLEIEKGTAFRIRHPSLEQDNQETLYGKIMSIAQNPNGGGYMVRYEPAKAADVFSKLNVQDSKTIDEDDNIECLVNDLDDDQSLANSILLHPDMLKTMYGVYNAFGVEPDQYKRSALDWGSRIDIRFSTKYDSSTSTFTFGVSAAYTFYPSEHITITLRLGYTQSMRYDVSASVSIEWEFIFPVGINYRLEVREDTTKEVEFGVLIEVDHAGEYSEEAVKKSVQKSILEAFSKDFNKKSVFKGDDPTVTSNGKQYPLFRLTCYYFFPLEIKFEIFFYWQLCPSFESLLKYTSHTQRVDLCVTNEKGADPSSQTAASCNKTLSFRMVGKLHAEVGIGVSLGVGVLGFYKFFHAEVSIKAYGALDLVGFITFDVSWTDGEASTSEFQIGGKFEISVGVKVGVDIYLLFGGYKHDWPIVSTVLMGFALMDAVASFINAEEDVYIQNTDYDEATKQFNLSLSERHLLTMKVMRGATFSVDTMEVPYDFSVKTRYGSWLSEARERAYSSASFVINEGNASLSLSDDGHIKMDTILGQEDFVATLTLTTNKTITSTGSPITKTIHIHFRNNDRQEIFINGESVGSYVIGAVYKLPVPEYRKYYKFDGYNAVKDGSVVGYIHYDEENPSSLNYTVTKGASSVEDGTKIYFETVWLDDYHWNVFFVDGLGNIVYMDEVPNHGTATPPEAEYRDRYMVENPPDDSHHYEFVKWDASLEDITGTTVIRGIYKIVEN